jgi:hypothetical protein
VHGAAITTLRSRSWTLSILACYSQMTIALALMNRGAVVEFFELSPYG